MKRFLIQYTFALDESAEIAWHARVKEFIAEIDRDPILSGRLTYRVFKGKNGSYSHIVDAADEGVVTTLNERAFFKAYTDETKRVSGGTVRAMPLDPIAATAL